VIEDIEGAAPEPTRRRHVAALSAAIATVSLVLLVALVVPTSRVATPPPAASPAAGVSAGPTVRTTIVSNPITGMRFDAGPEVRMTIVSNAISGMRVDLTHTSVCADGTRLIPPYDLAFEGVTGRVFAVGPNLSHSLPVAFRFDARTGWMTVSCATPDAVTTEQPLDDLIFAPSDRP